MSATGMAVSCPCLPTMTCTPALDPMLPATVPSPSDALKLGPRPAGQSLCDAEPQKLDSGPNGSGLGIVLANQPYHPFCQA